MSVLAMPATDGAIGEAVQLSPVVLFPGLVQSAQLELQASLQLLAERARFLTGACGSAIALKEDGQFTYRASAGLSVAESESSADVDRKLLHDCIATGKPVRLSQETSHEADSFFLGVPILRAQTLAGFFELTTKHAEFSRDDIEAISRLAGFAETALDNALAAEEAERRVFAPEIEFVPVVESTPPTLWHAPEQVAISSPTKSDPAPAAQEHVKVCTSCGFPVSPGRNLCVDCEQNPSTAVTASPLFAMEKQEGWIEAHGYTVASILVTALAVALIYWLR
jgi:hypothetical protein